MVLSDRTIKSELAAGRIVVDPYDPGLVQPSSIDVRVDRKFRVFHNARYPYIDVRAPMEGLTELIEVGEDDPFILHPGEFVLGQTLEAISLPNDIVARLEGKSSLGRLGLLIHSTAGFVDPSFAGQPDAGAVQRRESARSRSTTGCRSARSPSCGWTARSRPRTGQKGARSKYQGQAEPTPSRFYQNFE